MKNHNPTLFPILILCAVFMLAGCNQDLELTPEVIELDGSITYGTANLDITHHIPLGIGEVVVETSVPLKFAVKRGNRFIRGDISEEGQAESTWDLAAAGDVKGASSTLIVPATFEVRGFFKECRFTFDIVEVMHFSQVKTVDVLALGKIAVDMGEDEQWELSNKVLTSEDPKLEFSDPSVPGTVTLGISNASLPPDLRIICPYPTSFD